MDNIQDFSKKFISVFDDEPVLSQTDNFRELEEWDSMVALSVMAMIDEEYGVNLSGDEMRSTNTIQQLYDLVQRKKTSA